MTATCHIILADDHTLLRESVKMFLAQCPRYVVTGEAGDGLELLALLKQGAVPDVVILDLSMPRLGGIDAIREIRRTNLDVKVLVLTMHKNPDLLHQAFLAGADGYLLKDELADELFSALDRILSAKAYVSPLLAGEAPDCWLQALIARREAPLHDLLSSQEIEILRLLAKGESAGAIAKKLSLTARTVGHRRAKIMAKLHAKGVTDLAKYATEKE